MSALGFFAALVLAGSALDVYDVNAVGVVGLAVVMVLDAIFHGLEER